jgi:hypothetical protein
MSSFVYLCPMHTLACAPLDECSGSEQNAGVGCGSAKLVTVTGLSFLVSFFFLLQLLLLASETPVVTSLHLLLIFCAGLSVSVPYYLPASIFIVELGGKRHCESRRSPPITPCSTPLFILSLRSRSLHLRPSHKLHGLLWIPPSDDRPLP